MRGFWLVVCLGACGRIGFDVASSSVTGDGSSGDTTSTADAAPCTATALQLPIDSGATPEGSWVSQFRATPMVFGFGISYVAPDTVGFALTFGNVSGIAPIKTDTQIVPVTSTIEAVGVADNLVINTNPNATTTNLSAFNVMLQAEPGGSTRSGHHAVGRSLAANGTSLVFVDFFTGAEIDAHAINSDGSEIAMHPAIAATEAAQSVAVSAAAGGFLMTWIDTSRTPHVARAELLDANAIPGTPHDVGAVLNTTAQETTPSGAFAAAAGVHLFAWDEVHGADSQVWAQFTDNTLMPVGQPLLVGHGGAPKVASDGASFWVVWSNASSTLSGSHVTTDHVARAFDVPSSGGMAVDFDLIAFAGAVDLLWFERSGTGHPLWFVPACTL